MSLFNPESYSQIKKNNGAPDKVKRPGTLVFFLFHGIPLQEKPFACVAFEDIERLKDRICECLPFEWNVKNWMGIPPLSDSEYWNQFVKLEDHGFNRKWDPERGGMIQNCWHIPFRTLADMATVTLIGKDPVFTHKSAEIETLMKTRFDYVKRQANGRRIVM